MLISTNTDEDSGSVSVTQCLGVYLTGLLDKKEMSKFKKGRTCVDLTHAHSLGAKIEIPAKTDDISRHMGVFFFTLCA